MNASRIISWRLDPPRGAHPKSITSLELATLPCPADCILQLTHTLPLAVFADPYELQLYRDAYDFEVRGGRVDLEAPAFALSEQDEQVVDVRVHAACSGGERASPTLEVGVGIEVEVQVPLHVRYERPRSRDGVEAEVIVRPPEGHLTCTRSDDGALGADVDIRVLEIVPGVRAQGIRVPIGDVRHLPFVEAGTVLTVLAAFMWVGWRVIMTAQRLAARGRTKEE